MHRNYQYAKSFEGGTLANDVTTTDPLRKFGTVLLVKRFHITCSLLGSYDTTTRST